MHAFGKGREQRLVGKNVDASTEPFGGLADQLYGPFGERIRTPITGSAQAEEQVDGYITLAQRFQPEVLRDAVIELAHVCLLQAEIELGLTKEGNLQEFVTIGLEVGKQADFFQSLWRHGMGLVDQGHHLAPAAVSSA